MTDWKLIEEKTGIEHGSTFTVLLDRPDYMTDGRSSTFLWQGAADSPPAALAAARAAVLEADDWTGDPLDYPCRLLIAGIHDDLNPEI